MPEAKMRIRPQVLARARELRQPQTPLEGKLWACLRDRQLGGFKFRRQHPIDRFIVDFCCPARRLVIEVDGDSHADQVDHDQARTDRLKEEGYRVLRFTNGDVCHRLEGVLETILMECERQI